MESNLRKRKIDSDDVKDNATTQNSGGERTISRHEDTETFGLKPEFLAKLGIKPPIEKWVHVSNFRCDKTELKEVLELAGVVLICSTIYNVRGRYARVMYSHPLEAVQAVSMLNGQVYYGQKLKVTMTPSLKDTVVLPKGLLNVGPGLGSHGRPLRNIVKEYKKFLINKKSNVDTSLFGKSDDEETSASSDDSISGAVARPLNISNVEDLPDDESVSSEVKRARRDSGHTSVASDHESEDETKPNIVHEEPQENGTIVNNNKSMSISTTGSLSVLAPVTSENAQIFPNFNINTTLIADRQGGVPSHMEIISGVFTIRTIQGETFVLKIEDPPRSTSNNNPSHSAFPRPVTITSTDPPRHQSLPHAIITSINSPGPPSTPQPTITSINTPSPPTTPQPIITSINPLGPTPRPKPIITSVDPSGPPSTCQAKITSIIPPGPRPTTQPKISSINPAALRPMLRSTITSTNLPGPPSMPRPIIASTNPQGPPNMPLPIVASTNRPGPPIIPCPIIASTNLPGPPPMPRPVISLTNPPGLPIPRAVITAMELSDRNKQTESMQRRPPVAYTMTSQPTPFLPARPNTPLQPMGSGIGIPNQSVSLEFRNLPPSTTFQLLSEEVSKSAQLLSLNLTVPGCAIARFPNRVHADRCFQFFNGRCIDGCIIEVRYLS